MRRDRDIAARWVAVGICALLSSTSGYAQERAATGGAHVQATSGAGMVQFADGELSIDAKSVPLGQLLEEIARHSGIAVYRHVALDQRVTLRIDRKPLAQALQRILRHRSYMLEYARPANESREMPQIVAVRVLPQGNEPYLAPRPLTARNSASQTAVNLATLQAALSSNQARDREQAAMDLGARGDKSTVTMLSVALTDASTDVREAAIVALADVGGADAAHTVALALNDADPAVRQGAVDALGEIGGPVAIVQLQQALNDRDADVREAAAETLAQLQAATAVP